MHYSTIIQKANLTYLTNIRPIALANAIYKLFTSILTSIFSTYRERYQILNETQEGIKQERSTTRQIQTIIVALGDAKMNEEIYTYYTLTSKCVQINKSCQITSPNGGLGLPSRRSRIH